MTPARRDKIIRFAVAYGQSPINLSKRLGIPVDEVKAAVDAFLKQYPNIHLPVGEVNRKDR